MSQLKSITKNKEWEQLDLKERKIIEHNIRIGKSIKEISEILGWNISTIRREIKLGSRPQKIWNTYLSKNPKYPTFIEHNVYFCNIGQEEHNKNREKCRYHGKIANCKSLVEYVEKKVLGDGKWSPDAAIGYAKVNNLFPNQNVSTRTFYT